MISSESQAKRKATYPADHQPGMKVPEGGSNCSKCEYLKDRSKGLCGNKYFVKWNGSDKIPGDINSYCSDWFESA